MISGHNNILATHKNTLEFTKDKDLSLKGDCIVGVNADFSKSEIKQVTKHHKQLELEIVCDNISDAVQFEVNPEFNSSNEIVIRLSSFLSERTLGVKAEKGALHLKRSLIKKLQNPNNKAIVSISPKTKLFIFDFDDTLEDFTVCYNNINKKLPEFIAKQHNLNVEVVRTKLIELDKYFSLKQVSASPRICDRHVWFKKLAKELKIKLSKKESDLLVKKYWQFALEKAKALPHAKSLLNFLRKNYLLAVMSDSDGSIVVKEERIKKVGIDKYFDLIVTSDVIGQNKPSKKFYTYILNHFALKPKDCVMVGDKPEVDLKLAKKLGMITVHVKHGVWAKYTTTKHKSYVDYEVNTLKELLELVKNEF